MPIDFTMLPRGQMAWSDLVEHVRDTGDDYETDYLEVKSDVDPTTNVGRAKIAKYILGSANRLPDLAEMHFEGHGVMVLGVQKGAILGVPTVDEKDLKNYLANYTGGGARPTWWTERVEVPGGAGRHVFIIVVAPPRYGDPIFPCRKEFTEPGGKRPLLLNGGVYVRPSSETRAANAAEIDSLCQRLVTGHKPKATPVVKVKGNVYRCRWDSGLLEKYIEHVRDRLGTPTSERNMFGQPIVTDFRSPQAFSTLRPERSPHR
jgi:hypothetical protein